MGRTTYAEGENKFDTRSAPCAHSRQMKKTFAVGNFVIASPPSGECIGRVTQIREGSGAGSQLVTLWSPLSGKEKTFAGGWCRHLDLEMLAAMEAQELAQVAKRHEVLRAALIAG